jgi:hypothetical protein
MERFFKTLYYTPWIAYEWITVGYFQGRLDIFMDILLVVKRMLRVLQRRGREGVVIGGGRKKQGTSIGTVGGGNREELAVTLGMATKKLHHGIRVYHPVPKNEAQNLGLISLAAIQVYIPYQLPLPISEQKLDLV